MLVGVFDELAAADSVVSAALFRHISSIVARMDSFRYTIRLPSPLRDERIPRTTRRSFQPAAQCLTATSASTSPKTTSRPLYDLETIDG
jgi:hypothetical protein